MTGLLDRLKAAEGGSRELDAHVEVAVRAIQAERAGLLREHWAKWSVSRDFWVEDPHTSYQPSDHTTSLDAAHVLLERVLPGWEWVLRSDDERGFMFNCWKPGDDPNCGDPCFPGYGPTAALALCIAIVTASPAGHEGAAVVSKDGE